jgi:hypothetical protein
VSLLNYTLPNLWSRITRQKMQFERGSQWDCTYWHDGSACQVSGVKVAGNGGYVFQFMRDGKRTARIRLSYPAVDAMRQMLGKWEDESEPK